MNKLLLMTAMSAAMAAGTVTAGSWGDGNSNTNWNGSGNNNWNNNAYGNGYGNGWGDGSMDSDMDGDIEIVIKARGRGRGQADSRGSLSGRGYNNWNNNWDNRYQTSGDQQYLNNNNGYYAPAPYAVPPRQVRQDYYNRVREAQMTAARIKAAQVIAAKTKAAQVMAAKMKAGQVVEQMKIDRAYAEVIKASAKEKNGIPNVMITEIKAQPAKEVIAKAPEAKTEVIVTPAAK